jgi:periplasmic protein CpxP/Spy
MKSIRNLLAGSLMAAAVLATATTSVSVATAADDTTAPAAPGPHGWHHHPGQHLLSKLNLTPEQQASVKAIMSNAGPQMKSIHQQMRANSLKLQNTQPNDPNYANVVAEVTSANGALHSQMIAQQADVRAQVFKVLTPAQQTQLAALQAQMQSRRQGAAAQ